jgi:glycosyltransferase involved in cell wall biosynthesis
MQIAFYAPLKSPNHPVPSGDRQMARLLVAALELAGYDVDVISELRSFTATPEAAGRKRVAELAKQEIERLSRQWQRKGKPDLWFCYHPYYKAPDLIGPPLTAALSIPYVSAEASYSKRRDDGGWAELQAVVVDAVRHAAVNICFTRRDEIGLAGHIPEARLARLPPFIDASAFRAEPATNDRHRLVTIAMMRAGDKLESYRMLAKALALLGARPWKLSVIGDGPERVAVKAMFGAFGAERIEWLGQKLAGEVVDLLYRGGTFVWPGTGEAYGIAYLEAQAAGLPVVAQKTAGVPEVVKDGVTGTLTTAGDTRSFADAIAQMMDNQARRLAMGQAGRRFIREERSLDIASKRLGQLLREFVAHDG